MSEAVSTAFRGQTAEMVLMQLNYFLSIYMQTLFMKQSAPLFAVRRLKWF